MPKTNRNLPSSPPCAICENKRKPRASLSSLASSGKLRRVVADYLTFCAGKSSQKKENKNEDGNETEIPPRFPNVAGFCRFLGVGTAELDRLSESDPDSFSYICSVFEDEALNSPLASTLINSYLKHRLGYDLPAQSSQNAFAGIGDAEIVFEHDVLADGN